MADRSQHGINVTMHKTSCKWDFIDHRLVRLPMLNYVCHKPLKPLKWVVLMPTSIAEKCLYACQLYQRHIGFIYKQ